MKTTKIIITSAAILLTGSIIFYSCASPVSSKENESENVAVINPAMSTQAVELKTNMRKLWEDHIVWTRNVEFCIMDDLGGTDQAVNRLMKNQDDIGGAIKPYYGEKAGKDLTDLLRTHISTAAEVLKTAKSGDTKMYDEANARWHKNADEISMFLSKANPNWKMQEMKTMMDTHLALTTEEALARKNKMYNADVKAYDMIHDEILKMADMLSSGIVKQFPDKFKEPMLKM